MREYQFDPEGELPIVRAVLKGPAQQKLVMLVFDTGCAVTQVHHKVLSIIGCGPEKATDAVTIAGVTGPSESAYRVNLPEIKVLGVRIMNPSIAGVDFSKWADEGIEGLLGWDLIRKFHLDMNGPKGTLQIF